MTETMFDQLNQINARPEPFSVYTADALWTDAHTSRQMLAYHLNETIDMSSRNPAFIDRSVAWIAEHFKLDHGSAVADFGCGPGLYAQRLAQRGATVTGIDFSENSIAYARQAAAEQHLDITYVVQNYLEFDTTERFDLIVMIMCDFCALSPDQRQALLARFRSLLKPGGAVLLDVYSLISFAVREEAASYEFNQLSGFWSPDDYYGFVNTFKYDNEKVVLDKYTIVEAKRTRVVYNWLQHFSAESLKNEFEANGFAVDQLYTDVAGSPLTKDAPEMAVVAVCN